MTTISERLRERSAARHWFTPDELCTEAADTIDALVAALERMVAERHEPSGSAVQQADAALALARKGGE